MNMKKLTTLCFLIIAALPLFAADGDGDGEQHFKRTVIVRDGKVLVDEGDPFPGGKRAFIGVAMTELTPELREFFGAPKDAGVMVSSLSDNGPAAKAGLHVGDIIIAVNGKNVGGMWEVMSSMRDKHTGDSIKLDVIRGKARQTIVATAEERDLPQRMRAFDLGDLEHGDGIRIPMPPGEWRAKIAAPDNEELRARIKELETRLQELERKLQK
jgi:membrane-associated protease RseP (regulator of RpoE activity)